MIHCPIMINLFFIKHHSYWVGLSKHSVWRAFPQSCEIIVLPITWSYCLGGSTMFRCNVLYLSLSICLKCYPYCDILISFKTACFSSTFKSLTPIFALNYILPHCQLISKSLHCLSLGLCEWPNLILILFSCMKLPEQTEKCIFALFVKLSNCNQSKVTQLNRLW